MFKTIFLSAVISGFACMTAAEQPTVDFFRRPTPKLIEYSWNSPTTAYLRQNIREMEKCTPYQGIGIHVHAQGEHNGKEVLARHNRMFTGIPWKYEWFSQAIDDLKNTRFEKFTDNFIRTSVAPGDIDWFSDSDWAAVCNNFGILARIARECKLKGLALDIEVYFEPLFTYRPDSGHTLEATRAMARQRGREFGDAIFGKYPEMRLFCFFWLSDLRSHYLWTDAPYQHLLTAYFINGVYDRLPLGALIIDGNEELGYTATTNEDFAGLSHDIIRRFLPALDRANVNKAKLQTQLAPAIYLDPYFYPGHSWEHFLKPQKNPDRIALLINNLALAMEYTDEYVWTWGEKGSWWQKEKPEMINWGDRAPELRKAIEALHDPDAYAAEKLKAAQESGKDMKNLLKNHDFEQTSNDLSKIPHWSFWRNAKSRGTAGLAVKEGVGNSQCGYIADAETACLYQNLPAGLLDVFLVRGRAKSEGGARPPMLTVRWQTANGWMPQSGNGVFSQPDKDGWMSLEMLVVAPVRTTRLSLQLNGVGSTGKVYYDNIALYKL